MIPRLLLLSMIVTSAATAQVCKPGADTHEAKLLAFFAAPIAFSPSGMAAPMAAGEVRLGFDVTYVPSPKKEITSPEVCYTSAKTENTELSPVFPRPRISVGLGAGFALEASYLPPITVMDATPNLFAVALGYGRRIGTGGTHALVRAHATVGEVKGPITCSPDVIQNSNSTGVCYANEPSEDTYKPSMVGLEGAIGFGGGSRLRTYVGAGVTSLMPRFAVGFTDLLNNVDTTRVEVDLTRVAVFGGAAWQLNSRVSLTTELYSVPQDVTTIRLGGSYVLRRGR